MSLAGPKTELSQPSEGHEDEFVGKWIHSDIKNVALPYVSKMYKTLINEGKLSNSQ